MKYLNPAAFALVPIDPVSRITVRPGNGGRKTGNEVTVDSVKHAPPLPNNPQGPYGVHTFSQALSADGSANIFSTRLDHQLRFLRMNSTITGRFNWTDDNTILPSGLPMVERYDLERQRHLLRKLFPAPAIEALRFFPKAPVLQNPHQFTSRFVKHCEIVAGIGGFMPLAHQFVALGEAAGVVEKPPRQAGMAADLRPIERAFRQDALRYLDGIGTDPDGRAGAGKTYYGRGSAAEDQGWRLALQHEQETP